MQNNKYRIGKYEIFIPENFGLPNFQENCRLYDRFLPVLASFLPENTKIIDVGANIGDTLFSLINECENDILCVEASDVFFEFLKNNIKLLSNPDSIRVKSINEFVGTGRYNGFFEHTHLGTAKLVDDENFKISFKLLDDLVALKNNISLLKVDTDGFDFDVIMSANQIINESQPILFWENLIENMNQLESYKEFYNWLENNGYEYFCVFDNFGNIVFDSKDYKLLEKLNNYLISMELNLSVRTIYYFDIVACTSKYKNVVDSAIIKYKEKYIKQ